ncbi:MAG: long-chain fatty acid--CoA ligase [Gammaproteobacteria bacterium]|nr:MAG: long-chain fatty acid--CoA ligase [Gammaproteobacteria bacterium]
MDTRLVNANLATTLPALFRERLKLTPNKPAYKEYDVASQQWTESTWQEMAYEIARWQAGFAKEKLQAGDRVAVMLRNCRDWVVFDQAALGMGLVTVPLYVEDRPDNVAYIINHAEVKLLFVEDKPQWQRLINSKVDLGGLKRIISINGISEDDEPNDPRLESLADWLYGLHGELQHKESSPDDLASIVYTSGTTGRSKGVMLSHKNILSNVYAAQVCHEWSDDEVFLSFLPLSHMLERTAGYYLPMAMGAQVAYARSIPQLGEDLLIVRPTVLISVPRIYERVYGKIQDGLKAKSPLARALFKQAVATGWHRFEYEQGREMWRPSLLMWPLLNKLVAGKVLEKLGGRLRLAICGGAPLSENVAKLFIGLGLPLLQGYGLTESSPVISVNREDDNIPASIGTPLPGIEVRIGKQDELQSRSDSSMLGYWKNEQATKDSFTSDGWLRTGDKACIKEDGHIYITGRLKDIIVLANGEKVPPNDMEMAIALDPLFDQVVIIGEGRPFLSALVVINPEAWAGFSVSLSIHPDTPDALRRPDVEKMILERISHLLKDFPGYAHIRKVTAVMEPWTVDDGLQTPTLKIKRPKVMEKFTQDITRMYQGHEV